MAKKIFFLLVVSPVLLMLPGCKEKGCTNPKAVNYNNVATEDDGSCIICQESHNETGHQDAGMTDYNSGPHYNTMVAMFKVRQLTDAYNSGLCGEKNCRFEISVQSLISQNMSFNYQLSCSGDIYFNQYRYVSVAPFATIVVDTLLSTSTSNPCGNLSLCTVTATASGTISYW